MSDIVMSDIARAAVWLTAYRTGETGDDMTITQGDRMNATCHSDGTVTYWSVYEQVWIRHATQVPDAELAAMGADERRQVIEHLEGAGLAR